MATSNEHFYYVTDDDSGAYVGVLDTMAQIFDNNFRNKATKITVYRGENSCGELVAERNDGNWEFYESREK